MILAPVKPSQTSQTASIFKSGCIGFKRRSYDGSNQSAFSARKMHKRCDEGRLRAVYIFSPNGQTTERLEKWVYKRSNPHTWPSVGDSRKSHFMLAINNLGLAPNHKKKILNKKKKPLSKRSGFSTTSQYGIKATH